MRAVPFLLLAAAAHAQDPIVDIQGLGKIRGRVYSTASGYKVDEFLGIKYAEAPRFELPVKVQPWGNATVDAREYGHTCPGSGCITINGDNEDCLHLNVFRATGVDSKDRLPVYVWIHGGAYISGCSNDYPCKALVERSQGTSIVVAINYRLNAFGFLGSDQLRAQDGSTGNIGIQDQRASIQWVIDHIADFGGDPQQITIGGESAGAGSMTCQAVAPRSKGMFKRVIAESGFGSTWNANTLAASEKNYQVVLQALNCTTAACVKAATWQELEAATANITKSLVSMKHISFAPVVDGVEFTKMPWEYFRDGDYNTDLDFIAGSNRDECMAFLEFVDPHMTEQQFDELMTPLLRSAADLTQLKQVYSNTSYQYPADLGKTHNWWWWANMRAQSDQYFTCPARRLARWVREHAPSRDMFVYMFVHPTKSVNLLIGNGPDQVFVPHTAELFYVWDCLEFPDMHSCPWHKEDEKQLAEDMSGMWVNFINTGKPGSGWNASYNATADDIFILDVGQADGGQGFHYEDKLRSQACDFWDTMLQP
eukprot:TRINITY_DN13695_c0_g1_i1.p1 TRINITY_DN13695_c0_g1~~TRINITY_DN13695_c0_g1_i1.p1  ORF type:complete len:538 (+),score=156.90 TRINITY_DN13695_c0_g1_i1:42-1655(+)